MELKNRTLLRRIGLTFTLFVVAASQGVAEDKAHTNPLNLDPQVEEAYRYFYLLDYPTAVTKFERIHKQHPADPYATAMLLDAVVFQELYRQDLLDTTFYANDGFLTGKHATDEDPKKRDEIFALADEAVKEADDRIGKNSNDVDALFARGWVRSLRCTYVAMVERGFSSGFRLAGKAKDDCAHVLQIDPEYIDAKLVVGVYNYVVGALPLPFKFLIGFVGITGSKTKGMEMLRDDANRGPATSVEARTVIALFLRREGKYKEAIDVVRNLKKQYPRNYLFCLEEANLRKDAGEGMGAVYAYEEIVSDNAKPDYFSEARLELAYFGLGDALRGQRHYAEAAAAYEKAGGSRGVGPELKVRTLLAAGECHDLLGERQLALKDYQAAIAAGPNTSRADTARKRINSPYHGN
ncbi:tetratricopeptide repeat protein [Telmatobacter sp. DSM 110680]|uniref:Tetratricopeptide repeat protein n=1 Tax=Telmatobacter sp. DSM 110680 TaxID=3036704 RepID=A0AAU7DEZ0_9BACT